MNGFRRQNEELAEASDDEILLAKAPLPATDIPEIDLTQKKLGDQAMAVVDPLLEEDEDPKVQAIANFIAEAAGLMETIIELITKISERSGDLGRKGKSLRSKLLQLEGFIALSATIQTVDPGVISGFVKEFQRKGNELMEFIWNILDTSYDLEPEDQHNLIIAQTYIDELNQKATVLKRTNVAGVWEELRNPVINTLKIPKGLRICIVDDERHILDDTASMIDEAGGVAHKAMNLKQLSALGGQHVDVILLDHSLGEIKGHEALQEIRKLFPDAIVIVHTSEAKIILADDEKPYGNHPVVGKHDWKGINDALQRAGISQAA